MAEITEPDDRVRAATHAYRIARGNRPEAEQRQRHVFFADITAALEAADKTTEPPEGWTHASIAVAERNAVKLFDALARLIHLDNLACTSGLGSITRIRTAEDYRDAKRDAEALLAEIAG